MNKHWLVVTDSVNFAISRRGKFNVEGFQDHHENKVKNVIRPGDQFIYYIKGHKKFGAISEAISSYYYDETKIWKSHIEGKNELYPHRFKARPILVPANNNELLDAKKVVPKLSFITAKQRATSWGLAFHQSLKEIPGEDFELIQSEMEKTGVFKEVKPQE